MKWTLDVKNWGKFAIFRYPSQPFRTKWTLDGDFKVSATTLSDEMDVGRQKLTAKPDGAYRFSGLRAPGWRCWTRRLWWSHGSARGQPHGPHGADPWAASFPTVGCRGPRISLRLPGPAVTVPFQTSSLMGSQQPFSSDVLPLLMAGSGRRICIYIYIYVSVHTHTRMFVACAYLSVCANMNGWTYARAALTKTYFFLANSGRRSVNLLEFCCWAWPWPCVQNRGWQRWHDIKDGRCRSPTSNFWRFWRVWAHCVAHCVGAAGCA